MRTSFYILIILWGICNLLIMLFGFALNFNMFYLTIFYLIGFAIILFCGIMDMKTNEKKEELIKEIDKLMICPNKNCGERLKETNFNEVTQEYCCYFCDDGNGPYFYDEDDLPELFLKKKQLQKLMEDEKNN